MKCFGKIVSENESMNPTRTVFHPIHTINTTDTINNTRAVELYPELVAPPGESAQLRPIRFLQTCLARNLALSRYRTVPLYSTTMLYPPRFSATAHRVRYRYTVPTELYRNRFVKCSSCENPCRAGSWFYFSSYIKPIVMGTQKSV